MMDWFLTNIIDKRALTDQAVALRLKKPHGFDWKAGQFVNIRLDSLNEVRSYSIANNSDDDFIELGIKEKKGGKISPLLVNEVNVGSSVSISKADGRFILLPDASRRMQHVFIAAGSGITPIISMIKESLENEVMSDVILWYGSRNRKQQMYAEELEFIQEKYHTQFQYYPAYSGKSIRNFFGRNNLLDGRINKEKVNLLIKSLDLNLASKFYICGPEKMIEDTRQYLLELGILEPQIAVEFFVANKLDSGQKGTIHISGRINSTIPIEKNESILDAMISQNVDVNFACRNGSCGSCKMQLVEGEVNMVRDFALTKEEKESNHILGCQSTCVTKEISVILN